MTESAPPYSRSPPTGASSWSSTSATVPGSGTGTDAFVQMMRDGEITDAYMLAAFSLALVRALLPGLDLRVGSGRVRPLARLDMRPNGVGDPVARVVA